MLALPAARRSVLYRTLVRALLNTGAISRSSRASTQKERLGLWVFHGDLSDRLSLVDISPGQSTFYQ